MNRIIVSVATLSFLLAGCGSSGSTSADPKPKEPAPVTRQATVLPLAGPLGKKQIPPSDEVSNVVPSSGYVPSWATKTMKTYGCAPTFIPVKLKVNGAVEYKGSLIGHATNPVADDTDDESLHFHDHWVSSSGYMPRGLLVYSPTDEIDDNDNPINRVQLVDLNPPSLDGDKIVHIAPSDVEGKNGQIIQLIACYR